MAQSCSGLYCPDAYKWVSHFCKGYREIKRKGEEMIDNKDIFRFKKMLVKEDREKFQELIDGYKEYVCGVYCADEREFGTNTRLAAVREERKDWNCCSWDEQIASELSILNDTLALIYDYISEKK